MTAVGVRLKVAYDGAGFAGFARQRDQRTVQGVLSECASRIAGHPVLVRGASRTDAGVHALGQVIAFDSERELPLARWPLALNQQLPEDVAVRDVEPCAAGYDPRFDARDKTYRYLFHLGAQRDPLWRARAFALGHFTRGRRTLDLAAMADACTRFQGTHDFRAFRAAADTRESTVRTLLRVALQPAFAGVPELLALEVKGTAFMLNMVRILAGTLVEVGRGRFGPGDVSALLGAGAERRHAGPTAPAHGLTLLHVSLGRAREQASPQVP